MGVVVFDQTDVEAQNAINRGEDALMILAKHRELGGDRERIRLIRLIENIAPRHSLFLATEFARKLINHLSEEKT